MMPFQMNPQGQGQPQGFGSPQGPMVAPQQGPPTSQQMFQSEMRRRLGFGPSSASPSPGPVGFINRPQGPTDGPGAPPIGPNSPQGPYGNNGPHGSYGPTDGPGVPPIGPNSPQGPYGNNGPHGSYGPTDGGMPPPPIWFVNRPQGGGMGMPPWMLNQGQGLPYAPMVPFGQNRFNNPAGPSQFRRLPV